MAVIAERSFEGVQALTDEDVSDVDLTHGYSPSDAGGVALFLQSAFSVEEHVRIVVRHVGSNPHRACLTILRQNHHRRWGLLSSAGCDTMSSENDVGVRTSCGYGT